MSEQDISADLQAQVEQALANRTPLRIVGGNSKAFYGPETIAILPLVVGGQHTGIVNYEPSEQVITVRSGTALQTVTALLAEQGQMLAFEPPSFSPDATIGGIVACGLSGPRRPFAGNVRDFVLGCRIINGRAEVLRFGGEVIKNVAGFDVSRLMVGAMGQLGVLLDVSLRVLPMPEAELTLSYAVNQVGKALTLMQQWQRQPWPLSGLCYVDGKVWLRLSGAEVAIQAVAQKLGGDIEPEGAVFWQSLREQTLPFFTKAGNLWRINLAPATPPLSLSDDCLVDWGGAQRWLKTIESSAHIHAVAKANFGEATCFRGDDKSDWFRMEPEILALQQRIRYAFDPYLLFNPQRLMPQL